MRQNTAIYNLLSFLILIVSIVLLWSIPFRNFGYATLMCTNFLWILFIAWKSERLSPFFFFLSTFIFLFIGGRFWAELLQPDYFSMRRGNFFDETRIEDQLWYQSLTYVLLFLYTATLAYVNYPRKNKDKPIICYKRKERLSVDRLLMFVFWVLAPFVVYDVIHRLFIALTSGYLSLYAMQSQNVAAGSGLVASMLYVFFGIALVYGNDRTKKLFLILMFIKAIVFVLIGQRAKFGSLLLFFIWYFLRNKNTNIIKIGILTGGSLFLLMWLASLSIRGDAASGLSTPFKILSQFFYSQGVSLTTFTCSERIDHYPVLPYLVSFLPGVASVASFFGAIQPYEVGFANYMAYNLNPGLYNSGHGLGWTLLSDLYLYSGRNYFIFTILSVLFGHVCAKVEDKARTSPFIAVIVFTTFLNLTFLPRAGLYTIIPLIVWIWLVYTFIDSASPMFRKVQLYHAPKEEEESTSTQENKTEQV